MITEPASPVGWTWNTLQEVKLSWLANRGGPRYDPKLHLMVSLQFWKSGKYGVPLLFLFYFIFVMIPRFTLTLSGSMLGFHVWVKCICLYIFCLYLIKLCKKKCKYEHIYIECGSLISRHEIILNGLACCYKDGFCRLKVTE